MSVIRLTPDICLTHTPAHLHLRFAQPLRVLSCAVLKGGFTQADHLLNLKVPKRIEVAETPETSLQRYAQDKGWQGTTVGMMTAASMNSFRYQTTICEGVTICALVTCGLSNLRRAGDPADVPSLLASPPEAGTINTILLTDAQLTDAAMVEAMMIITEAKTALMHSLDLRSPISGAIATGTGTDATAIISGHGPQIAYSGKHVRLGEVIASLTAQALADSIDWYFQRPERLQAIQSPAYQISSASSAGQ